MKQSEIDRELRQFAKTAAKKHGWKAVNGMPYWTIGPLFFTLAPLAIAKQGSFHCSLTCKWLELDRLLWQVLDLSSNESAPFSLHANGVFVLRGHEVYSISADGLEWLPGVLAQQVEDAAQQASERAKEVAARVTSMEAYLEFIRQSHADLMQRYPKAVTNIWMETLLIAMASGDMASAAGIARERIAAGDSGGFLTNDCKSFYQCALAHCAA